jgi:hypothetical protein
MILRYRACVTERVLETNGKKGKAVLVTDCGGT